MQYKFNLSNNKLIIIGDLLLLQTGLTIQSIKALCQTSYLPADLITNLKHFFQNQGLLKIKELDTLKSLFTDPDKNNICEEIFKDLTTKFSNSNYFKEVLFYEEKDTLAFIKKNVVEHFEYISSYAYVKNLTNINVTYGEFFQAFYENERFFNTI